MSATIALYPPRVSLKFSRRHDVTRIRHSTKQYHWRKLAGSRGCQWLCFLYLEGSSSASSSLSLVSDNVHTTSSSSSCWLTSNWLRALKSCIIRSTINWTWNAEIYEIVFEIHPRLREYCPQLKSLLFKRMKERNKTERKGTNNFMTSFYYLHIRHVNKHKGSLFLLLTTGGLLCTSRSFSDPVPSWINGAVCTRVPRGLERTILSTARKVHRGLSVS